MNNGTLFPGEIDAPALPPGATYIPHFLDSGAQLTLVRAIDAGEWILGLKRRVQHYGYRYDYKGRKVDRAMHLGALPDFAAGIACELLNSPPFAQMPDQLIVNEYEPGQGISAHIDCETCFNDRVAVISLGWPYEMEFRHTQTGNNMKLLLGLGSLLVLASESRYLWTHQIRQRRQDNGIERKRRLSLTFRKVVLPEPG